MVSGFFTSAFPDVRLLCINGKTPPFHLPMSRQLQMLRSDDTEIFQRVAFLIGIMNTSWGNGVKDVAHLQL
jgi:hypothetical protein